MINYVIVNKSEVASFDFSKLLNTSADFLRTSNLPTKCIVKYQDNKPSFLDGKTIYTHAEILEITKDSSGDWYTESDLV
jgi:hypothetical protein